MIWKALLNRIDQLPVAVDRTWLPALQATQEVYRECKYIHCHSIYGRWVTTVNHSIRF